MAQAKENYEKYYSEQVFKQNFNKIIQVIL